MSGVSGRGVSVTEVVAAIATACPPASCSWTVDLEETGR
jgi:hypothetical protein